MRQILPVLIALSISSAVSAEELYTEFPTVINSDERYVFYSHGLIVEGDDPRPEHPEFGIYEFPEIKQTLFDGGGFNLIAQQRPKNTDIASYVEQLVSWVNTLIEAGVKPAKITLVGFSRGGQLTAFASSRLKSTGINTAIMAICLNGDFGVDPLPSFGGNVLSIYETSDVAQSCKLLLDRSVDAMSTKEIVISTEKNTGLFLSRCKNGCSH